ncbi:hypothetical protein D187_007662 [Cystobacter fuscus DSM 2262]|uniref:Uncharacterized protein n=1 Tax=Cystobacter fuscus (strain ATCC 25194 / DSM 2262 / NBRC 100088 / M29) TaxID=1242864 RepID=S9NVU8_CYSF2|nr:hypothetical protein [Cystobacter fuscus]EPX56320.1 hypothetical protein D187_007662 [Cystobacter fuscus DSM 2262]
MREDGARGERAGDARARPYAEKVRPLSRLVTAVVLTVGTAGAGTAKESRSGCGIC